MANKSLNFIVPLVIFPFDIMVSFGETDKQLKQNLKSAGSQYDKEMQISPNGLGRFCMNELNQSVLRMQVIPSSCNEYGTLQHEIFHAVTYILHRIGVKLCVLKSDEVYAYLTEEIYKKINH